MLTHLSSEWIDALDAAAGASEALAEATRGLSLVIEQRVHDHTATEGEPVAVWHVTVDDGTVRFLTGPAAAPTVHFSTDRQTAAAIAGGTLSAQGAFMTGRLRVGGDTGVLVEHHDVLAGIHDVFASVRTRTAT